MHSPTPLFQLLPLTWQSISAVATFLAVVVALFWPTIRDRKRLKLSAMLKIDSSTPGWLQGKFSFNVTVVNLGRNRINIKNWGYKCPKQKGEKRADLRFCSDRSLPKILDHFDDVILSADEFSDRFSEVQNIFVRDAGGKYWYLKWREIRELKREYKDYIKKKSDDS